MQTAYVAIIEKGIEGYGVFFPDIPGLVSYGATPGEAASNAVIAAQGHVALLQEMGETLAPPTALEDIEVDGDIQEVTRVMVPVETADEKQRVNITLPKSVLAALDGIAGLRGQDRSSMIADMVRRYVGAPALPSGAPMSTVADMDQSTEHASGLYKIKFSDPVMDHAWSIFGRKSREGQIRDAESGKFVDKWAATPLTVCQICETKVPALSPSHGGYSWPYPSDKLGLRIAVPLFPALPQRKG